jgi:hypothetical protein
VFNKGLGSASKKLSSAPNNSAMYVPLIKASSLDLIKRSILFHLFGAGIIIVEQVA